MLFGNPVNYGNSVDLLEYYWRRKHADRPVYPLCFKICKGVERIVIRRRVSLFWAVPNNSRHRTVAILFTLISTRNKTMSRLHSLVHVRFCVSRKPQFIIPIFVTPRNCPHILIPRHLIVPNGKSFGHEQPLEDLDLEILSAGR